LTPQRDRAAAEAFLRKAIRTQGLPETITIDKSGAYTAAIRRYNTTQKTAIIIRHSTYLNTLVEQDSSSRETTHAAEAGLQIVLDGPLYDWGD
jgi:putative transposase